MNDPRLAAAIARGATIVTPNKRLAREVVAEHDAEMRAAGLAAWPAARALPWASFVAELWQRAADRSMPGIPAHRLDDRQASLLWRRIVAADLGDRAPLVDAVAAARLAAEAWQLVHAYGAGGESWRGFAQADPDPAAFARWAEAFARETAVRDAQDAARAPDALVRIGAGLRGLGFTAVATVGFLERSPQQDRLLGALAAAGVAVDAVDPDVSTALPPTARLAATPTPRDEIALALAWALDRACRDPSARIGVAIADLADQIDTVRALAADILCPSLQWPGQETSPRPYDVSAADALDASPLVAAALDLIALAHGPIDVAAAAALVRSPYLPEDPQRWPYRAGLERGWLEGAAPRLSLPAVRAALAGVDARLAERLQLAEASVRLPSRTSPRSWVEHWRRWLDAVGWCAGRALSSAEHQAKSAWSDLLASFAALSGVAGDMPRDEALALLRSLAAETAFQPETGDVPIRILGLLEAAGLTFDALRVTGLTAEAWPRSPAPNPLLPVAWQRERGIPRSHAARELDYARRLTACLARSAPEVVFSHAVVRDDHPAAPSPLIAGLAPLPPEEAPPSTARAMFQSRPRQESRLDTLAPALTEGAHVYGGAGLLDAQSTCPFRATLRYRLAAREWPEQRATLDAAERGELLHATLEAFWRGVRTHAALVALSDADLDARIDAAAASALGGVDPARWRALPPIVAGGERARLVRTVRDWIDAVERPRSPFRVVALEAETARRARVGTLALDVKFDRLDLLDDGTAAILDYKSGRAVPPAKWFEPRPQAPQLALYAAVHAQAEDAAPVCALAYGQLRPGDVRAVGLADHRARFPGLSEPADVRGAGLADWPAASARLAQSIAALADGIARGDAPVAPRDDAACTWCHLHAVCRIAGHEAGEGDSTDDGGRDD
jgi:ATP-dependent helicase/nuclease subunit B